jgi:hypothetical protein
LMLAETNPRSPALIVPLPSRSYKQIRTGSVRPMFAETNPRSPGLTSGAVRVAVAAEEGRRQVVGHVADEAVAVVLGHLCALSVRAACAGRRAGAGAGRARSLPRAGALGLGDGAARPCVTAGAARLRTILPGAHRVVAAVRPASPRARGGGLALDAIAGRHAACSVRQARVRTGCERPAPRTVEIGVHCADAPAQFVPTQRARSARTALRRASCRPRGTIRRRAHSSTDWSSVQLPIGMQHAPVGKHVVVPHSEPAPCGSPPNTAHNEGTMSEHVGGSGSTLKQQAWLNSGQLPVAQSDPSPRYWALGKVRQ